MHELSKPLSAKRLYIAHVAAKLESMEAGLQPTNAVAYRLFARRLKTAVAGYPEALLVEHFGTLHASVTHVLEQRHFDAHGVFRGKAGAAARRAAARLLQRVARPGLVKTRR